MASTSSTPLTSVNSALPVPNCVKGWSRWAWFPAPSARRKTSVLKPSISTTGKKPKLIRPAAIGALMILPVKVVTGSCWVLVVGRIRERAGLAPYFLMLMIVLTWCHVEKPSMPMTTASTVSPCGCLPRRLTTLSLAFSLLTTTAACRF